MAPLALALLAAGAVAGAAAGEIEVLVRDADRALLADAAVIARFAGRPAAGLPGNPPRATIAQIDKEFVPYVSVIRTGTAVEFPNHDDVFHNVYSFSKAKSFQLPLYKNSPPKPIVFDTPGTVVLGCNIHDWMVAYVHVVDTPYFAKTGSDGRAVLRGLPAGDYRVSVWHPRQRRRASTAAQRVHLGAGETRRFDFTVALKPEWRRRRRE